MLIGGVNVGQSGFDDHKSIWKCTECGHKNSISAANVYESEEDYRKNIR
jgi:ribosomal protein L37AE/L43A